MCISDWISDVCSSDLIAIRFPVSDTGYGFVHVIIVGHNLKSIDALLQIVDHDSPGIDPSGFIDWELYRIANVITVQSEERRVGKECVSTCRSRRSTED